MSAPSFLKKLGPRRSFEEIGNDAQRKTEEKKKQIETKKNQPLKKVDTSKKEELISKGQRWFNKFLAGIKPKERGNLKIEFNEDLDLQIMEVYNYKLSNLSFVKNYYDDFHIKYSGDFMRVLINLGLGLKLLKANTDNDKVIMSQFKPLSDLEFKLPKNLAALINCVGKTDVGNDVKVRIVGQNSVIKQSFFKAIMLHSWWSESKFYNNMRFNEGVKFKHVQTYVNQNLLKYSSKRLYTRDLAGLDIIHSYGKKAIDFVNKMDINIGTEDSKVFCRLPYLDPKHADDIEKISEWETKTRIFFQKINFSGEDYLKIMGYVFLGWFPLKFIANKDKTFSQLDERFKNSLFKDVKPDDILKENGWHDLNAWMDDDMLYENIITVFQYYNNSMQEIYDDLFKMDHFKPTEFGTGAQAVQVKKWKQQYLNYQINNFQIDVPDTGSPSEVFTKVTDEDAVIGSVFSFNSDVTYESGYNINMIGKGKEVRMAYLGHDFK